MTGRPIARVFDFDDTLAMSRGFIRILHYENGEVADTEKWMKSMGIEGKIGPLGSVEISTDDYAKYATIAAGMARDEGLLIQRPGSEVKTAATDIIDYSGVAKILAPKPIHRIIEIAKLSFARGEIIGIITGRSGGDGMFDVTGKWIKIDNKKGITRFLRKHGLIIDQEDIHCVGDIPGGVPYNKAEVMRVHFVEKYDPETIMFYDDDKRNLTSVATVDRRIHCIDSNEMGEGWGTIQGVIEAGSVRRRKMTEWSRAVKKSGIDR